MNDLSKSTRILGSPAVICLEKAEQSELGSREIAVRTLLLKVGNNNVHFARSAFNDCTDKVCNSRILGDQTSLMLETDYFIETKSGFEK